MSIPATYATTAEASKAGWFSRRHHTSEAHRKAQGVREAEERERATRIAAQHKLTAEKKEAEKAKLKQEKEKH